MPGYLWKTIGLIAYLMEVIRKLRNYSSAECQGVNSLDALIGEIKIVLDSSHDCLPVGTHLTFCCPNGRHQEAQELLKDSLDAP